MKSKKILLIFIMFLMFILLNSTNSYASSFHNWNFDVQVNSDGSMDVIETWDIYISEVNTLYKTFELDSSKFSNITNVKVEEIKKGKSYPLSRSGKWGYHLTKDYYYGGINNDGDFEICWGVGLDDDSETRTYVISYTVNDVVKKYGDCAEIYWQFIGENFEIGAKNVTGTIKLPKRVSSKEDIKVWGHTEYLNGEIYVTDTDTVSFTIDKYKAKNFVEVRILTPTNIFPNVINGSFSDKMDEIVEEETIWAKEANIKREKRDKKNNGISLIFSTIALGLSALLVPKIGKYKKELKENPKIVPEEKLDYYRELPDETATPLEAAFILNGSQNISKTLAATILNLTLKGALKGEQQENKKIKFEIQSTVEIILTKEEQKVFDLLVKSAKKDEETHKYVVEIKDVEKYIRAHTAEFESLNKDFESIAKNEAARKEKFDKSKETEKYRNARIAYGVIGFYLFIGIIGLIICSLEYAKRMALISFICGSGLAAVWIINMVMCSKLESRLHGFTQKGINEREKWRAFKKYMEDFSLLDEREVPELILWEKYLVYATAFGVAEKVIKQLKIKFPELNDPDSINNFVLFSAMNGRNGLNTDFISSISSSTSHMYSSTYSSGSGGGGGFSGGGGGGGRRRWRPEAVRPKNEKWGHAPFSKNQTLIN